MTPRLTTLLCRIAVTVVCLPGLLGAQAPAPPNDLDAFMAKVLERRNENWRALHDYILSEREGYEIVGPAGMVLEGMRREFTWFVRDGYLVRSPVKANGATVSEAERRRYEDHWLAEEEHREERRQKRAAGAAGSADGEDAADQPAPAAAVSAGDVVRASAEPRFISEAYFMRFRFEPGNYFLAGRETLDGRPVLRIEYYPTNMFRDDKKHEDADAGAAAAKREPGEDDRDDQLEADIDRAMNKVTLVTLWVDPAEYQIVRFTFANADFGFLPGRMFGRVDQVQASMTMGVFFGNVWLPREVAFSGAGTVASGTFRFAYTREFYDYRKGEVSAKIRAYIPKERRP